MPELEELIKEFIQYLDQQIRENPPQEPFPYFLLAACYKKTDPQKAIKFYKKCLHYDHQNRFSGAHFELASLYLSQGNPQKAQQHFNKLFEIPEMEILYQPEINIVEMPTKVTVTSWRGKKKKPKEIDI